MVSRNSWTREEFIYCLAFYASLGEKQRRVPPKRLVAHISLATGRSEGSIKLRFANFNSVDPTFTSRGLVGMSGGGSTVVSIWHEFSDNEGELDSSKLLKYLADGYFHLSRKGE